MRCVVAIFAHREERRIAACLRSLPLCRPDTEFHLLVNGSNDRTAAIGQEVARLHPALTVHDWQPGGKARTWNRFVHDVGPERADCWIFMDGDAEITTGSIDALQAAVAQPGVNAAAGMPMNGRQAELYRAMLHSERGLFGDLYALSGDFVARIRQSHIRLPEDLIGDDGLIAAMAATDLRNEDGWDRERIFPCDGAGFLCAPVRLIAPSSWLMQYKRMTNYSVRHFQNRIISDIMKREGPAALPPRMATLYPRWWDRFVLRTGITGWFDRRAIARMHRAAAG